VVEPGTKLMDDKHHHTAGDPVGPAQARWQATLSRLKRSAAPVAVVVTGGIGSGKSAFCDFLRQRSQVAYLNADQVGHQLLETDPRLRKALNERFGETIMSPGGDVDRARLAALVFDSPSDLDDLEALLHPPIQEFMAREVETLKQTPGLVIVLAEIPLLVEAGIPEWRDLIVTIETELSLRFRRLARRGLSREQIEHRLERQGSDRDRREISDLIVPNNGDLNQLKDGADRFWIDMERLTEPETGV
jgi:dephospho-CoA kinase